MTDMIETIGMMLLKGIVLPAFGLLVTWSSVHLSMWLASKVKNERVRGILTRLEDLTFTVVKEMQQTVVDKLGDKADAAMLAAARDQAIAVLKSHLGPQGLQEMEKVLGLENQDAVIKLIISYIESAVHSAKQARFAATNISY